MSNPFASMLAESVPSRAAREVFALVVEGKWCYADKSPVEPAMAVALAAGHSAWLQAKWTGARPQGKGSNCYPLPGVGYVFPDLVGEDAQPCWRKLPPRT